MTLRIPGRKQFGELGHSIAKSEVYLVNGLTEMVELRTKKVVNAFNGIKIPLSLQGGILVLDVLLPKDLDFIS